MNDREILPLGSVIGILGGGQLGKFLSIAAANLGFRVCVFDASSDSIASQVSWRSICAEYDNKEALSEFAAMVDVVTYETENIPLSTVEFLISSGKLVRPGAKALAITQDRLHEKEFINNITNKSAFLCAISSDEDLNRVDSPFSPLFSPPWLLKACRLGYDGKSQILVNDKAHLKEAWEALDCLPCILERYISLSCEFSIIGARGITGDCVFYDSGENIHSDGILRQTTIPKKDTVDSKVMVDMVDLVRNIMHSLEYIGTMAVEFFCDQSGDIIINEIAPRVHNTGHWTLDACACSQFEQHIRAICGWPLGSTLRYADAVMDNILGDAVADWPIGSSSSETCLYLYGKDCVRPRRKMGHVTRLKSLS